MGRLYALLAVFCLPWASALADGTLDLTKLPPAATRPVDFARDIQPLFKASCITCHGPEKQRGGLRLDHPEEAKSGGNSGPLFVPGKATQSRLLLAVSGLDPETRMPPEGKPSLTPAEVSLVRAWIDQGAVWPQGGPAVAAIGPQTTHWAFRPLTMAEPPRLRQEAWVRTEIDRWILARLEAQGFGPAPEADRATLVRRLFLDLLGLPPSPAEVQEFLEDSRANAYEQLVDRLLNSPHYGERWGRHWLDAARYADSDGYEKDTGRPFAWRYRDWVIEALNRDIPFDQFTVEQLAGDLLPQATIEQKVATGFHRNTLTNREGGVDQEQYRVEQVIDRVNTTARVFLGVTLGCAQCHDHKYDPFSQRDYYQFFAFFNSDREVDLPAPTRGDAELETRRREEHATKAKILEKRLADYRTKGLVDARVAWEKGLTAETRGKLPGDVGKALAIGPEMRTDAHKKAIGDYHGKIDPKLTQLTKAVSDHAKAIPTGTLAQTLAVGPERATHILVRGDFLRPGAQVRPATPAVLARASLPKSSATRLDLARWLVNPSQPLTPRVTVNWVWQKYFGRGLVATPEDFGTQGEMPSHPELLDALALGFIKDGWSLKALHRRIVASSVYRQSSASRLELVSRDPLNILLGRQNRLRLEAEILRDCSLAASGLLAQRVGGPSVRPPQPAGIAELSYAGSVRWVESSGSDRYRRGMYTWFQRTSPYPMLMTFDAPDSNVCAVRRERSNTPLQALTLLNDPVFVECARSLGNRLMIDISTREGSTEPTRERLLHGVRLCLAREARPEEADRLMALYKEAHDGFLAKPTEANRFVGGKVPPGFPPAEAAAYVAVARALLNLDEFMTRE